MSRCLGHGADAQPCDLIKRLGYSRKTTLTVRSDKPPPATTTSAILNHGVAPVCGAFDSDRCSALSSLLRLRKSSRRLLSQPAHAMALGLLPILLLWAACAGVVTVSAAAEVPSVDQCIAETPKCADPTQKRCECHDTCRYFGSCCADATVPPSAAALPAGNLSPELSLAAGTDWRLPATLYECEPQRFGGAPTFVISGCPERGGVATIASRTTPLLAELCNRSSNRSYVYDARFWPVSSVVTGVVYRSIYCAQCHGESKSALRRWRAAMNCTAADVSDQQKMQTRCYPTYFSQPHGANFRPSHCWTRLVDWCEPLPRTAPANISAYATTEAVSSVQPTPQSSEETNMTCQRKPQALVWRGETPYRNSYCTECSGVPKNTLSCFDHPQARPGIEMNIASLLDPAGPFCPECPGDETDDSSQRRVCRADQCYDYLSQKCVPICDEGTISLDDGSCAEVFSPLTTPATRLVSQQPIEFSLPPQVNSSFVLSTPKSTFSLNISRCQWTNYERVSAAAMTAAEPVSASSAVFPSANNEPSSNGGRTVQSGVANNVSANSLGSSALLIGDVVYAVVENATAVSEMLCAPCAWLRVTPADGALGNATTGLYWKQRWYRRPLVRPSSKVVGATLVCVQAESHDVSSSDDSRCGATLDAIGISLMIASIACLAVHAVVFFFVSSLRSMPGRVVFSQVVALLLAYVLYFSRAAAEFRWAACYGLGVAVHYFLLSYFAWTLVLAVEIHGAVRALKRVYSGSRQFAVYSIAGWLLPLIFVVAAVSTDHFGPELLRPGYGPPQCWMSNSYGFVIFFTGPMCFIVLADIVLYSAIIVRVAMIARQTAQARSTDREKAVLCLKLLLALGVLWTFAVGAAFSENTFVLCVLSNVLNASQGVFIFAIFFCADKGVQALVSCDRLRTLSERVATGASSLLSRGSGSGSGVGNDSHDSGSNDGGADASHALRCGTAA